VRARDSCTLALKEQGSVKDPRTLTSARYRGSDWKDVISARRWVVGFDGRVTSKSLLSSSNIEKADRLFSGTRALKGLSL
jgi:hypothetical protein